MKLCFLGCRTLLTLAAFSVAGFCRATAQDVVPVDRSTAANTLHQVSRQPGTAFAKQVVQLLDATEQTEYQHTTEIDKAKGTVRCDCSGLIGYMLRQQYPEAYVTLRGKLAPWRRRPLAATYYEAFVQAENRPQKSYWRRIHRLADVLPGDVMAWRKAEVKKGSTTGHVLMIAGQPELLPNGHIKVSIIDSTRSSTRQGIGQQPRTFVVDSSGKPVAQVMKGQPRKDIIAIGRLVNSKAPTASGTDQSFQGLSLKHAQNRATAQGLESRIIRNDNQPLYVPWKIKPERLNFIVKQGIVVDVIRG